MRSTERNMYSELFWSAFCHIRTEYGEILRISPYSVRLRKNTDQNNSEDGHFLQSGPHPQNKLLPLKHISISLLLKLFCIACYVCTY